MGRVRVYIASSLDGFIAGEGDDLSWLPGADGGSDSPDPEAGALGFDEFIADVGALLMGRRTYDVVCGFGGPWPYGERPVLVATHRALRPAVPSVQSASGSIGELVEQARAAAGDLDVYIDGGVLIRQALDADLVDDIVVTIAPTVLGAGHSLFAGAQKQHSLDLLGAYRYGSMLQMHLRPRR